MVKVAARSPIAAMSASADSVSVEVLHLMGSCLNSLQGELQSV